MSQLPLDAVTGELPDISRTTTLDKEAPRSIASSRGTNGSTTPFANANGAAMAVAAPLAAMSLKDMETKGNAMSGGDPPSSMDDQSNGSAKSNGAVITVKDVKGPTTSLATPPTHMHAHTATVTPANLKRTLTSQTISSAPQAPSPAVAELTVTPGYRAAEAYVRPCPVYVAGRLISYAFDLRQCEFTLKLDRGDRGAVLDAHPTIIYLPEFHFPRDHKVVVDVSSGKWEISEGEIASPGTPTAANGKRIANDTLVKVNADLAAIEADGGYAPGENDGDPPVQRLRWWHGDGEQTLRVTGLIRRATFAPEGGLVGTTGGVPGGNAADEDASYLEQCQQGYGVNTSSCTLM